MLYNCQAAHTSTSITERKPVLCSSRNGAFPSPDTEPHVLFISPGFRPFCIEVLRVFFFFFFLHTHSALMQSRRICPRGAVVQLAGSPWFSHSLETLWISPINECQEITREHQKNKIKQLHPFHQAMYIIIFPYSANMR